MNRLVSCPHRVRLCRADAAGTEPQPRHKTTTRTLRRPPTRWRKRSASPSRATTTTPSARSDAASQGTIRAELLKSRPPQRPGEVLEFVPGMIVTQHSGDGKANQYFLRGYNLDHGTDFATSVGGIPVNMPTSGHGQGYTDLNFLIPELVQRIDYRKGPYFASAGDFSAAGAADIVYRTRLDAPFAFVTLGENQLPARPVRRLGRRGGRHHAARRVRSHAQRRAVDAARKPETQQRRGQPRRRHVGARLEHHADGLRRALELHRPDPAATDRRRHLQRPAVRPLRRGGHAPTAARRSASACRANGTATSTARLTRVLGLRDALQAQAVLQLHLRARPSGRRRPVLADRRARCLRPARQPRVRPHARRLAGAQRVRPAAAPRPHPRRPVRHRGAQRSPARRATTTCASRWSACTARPAWSSRRCCAACSACVPTSCARRSNSLSLAANSGSSATRWSRPS